MLRRRGRFPGSCPSWRWVPGRWASRWSRRDAAYFDCPPAASALERLFQIYGDVSDLIELRKEAGGLVVTGYLAPLAETGPKRGPQNVFINGRLVRDRTIAHAIADAYSVASIKERSPEVHLFIAMPLDAVDVNVHPTKAEVRFREQSFVHQVVRRAVADALGQGPAPALTLTSTPNFGGPVGETLPIPGVLAGGFYPSRWRGPVPSHGGAEAPSPQLHGAFPTLPCRTHCT